METDSSTLKAYLSQFSFSGQGDAYERTYGQGLSANFPNCEMFWREFVVPLTLRLTGYPASVSPAIGFRPSTSYRMQDLCATHYSLFLQLVYAGQHLAATSPCATEDFYVHLGSACDLVELFLEKAYLILLECRGQVTKVLQTLSLCAFLRMAAAWYSKHYRTTYEHYLAKGRSQPLNLPSRKHIVSEFLSRYLGQKSLWKAYSTHAGTVRQFRNVVVHDVQVARVVGPDGIVYMPRPSVVGFYRTWRQVSEAATDPTKLRRDFVAPSVQLREDLATFESIANTIWGLLIETYRGEFYSNERDTLRQMYGINLRHA